MARLARVAVNRKTICYYSAGCEKRSENTPHAFPFYLRHRYSWERSSSWYIPIHSIGILTVQRGALSKRSSLSKILFGTLRVQRVYCFQKIDFKMYTRIWKASDASFQILVMGRSKGHREYKMIHLLVTTYIDIIFWSTQLVSHDCTNLRLTRVLCRLSRVPSQRQAVQAPEMWIYNIFVYF